jgi:hypothetical protein
MHVEWNRGPVDVHGDFFDVGCTSYRFRHKCVQKVVLPGRAVWVVEDQIQLGALKRFGASKSVFPVVSVP